MSQFFAVLRHGERADYAETRRITLVEGDPPLTELGLIQADIAADEVLSKLPKFDSICVISSPFHRCVETASKLAKKVGVPVIIEEGFAEIMSPNYFQDGILDRVVSKTQPEVIETELGVKVVQGQHVLRPVFPETMAKSITRIKTAWELFYPKVKEYQVVVIVTHLFVVDELFKHWTGVAHYFDDGYCKLGVCEFRDNRAVPLVVPYSGYVDEQYSLLKP